MRGSGGLPKKYNRIGVIYGGKLMPHPPSRFEAKPPVLSYAEKIASKYIHKEEERNFVFRKKKKHAGGARCTTANAALGGDGVLKRKRLIINMDSACDLKSP
jgi:hypothetical protein